MKPNLQASSIDSGKLHLVHDQPEVATSLEVGKMIEVPEQRALGLNQSEEDELPQSNQQEKLEQRPVKYKLVYIIRRAHRENLTSHEIEDRRKSRYYPPKTV